MSTQYDNIHTPYYKIRHSSIAFIERANVKDAAAPYIMGSNVLDLACGAGFYSYEFLGWGGEVVQISCRAETIAFKQIDHVTCACFVHFYNFLQFKKKTLY